MRIRVAGLLLLVFAGACPKPPPAPSSSTSAKAPITWPTSWADYLGTSVTIDGSAVDTKLGAILLGEGAQPAIWIDGLESWPTGFYRGGDQGKRVRVTGTVIVRKDLPVFVPKEGEPVPQGIPVAPGTDLDAASTRYLLAGATWIVLE